MKRTLFSRAAKSKAFVATQTGADLSNPFSAFDNYSPSVIEEYELYKSLKNSVPVLSAAVTKLVRLTGGFKVICSDKKYQDALDGFCENISVGGSGNGLDRFISVYFDSLLTYGTAVGEIVITKNGKVHSLYNTPLSSVILQRNPADSTSLQLCRYGGFQPIPVKYPNLTMFTTLNPEAGDIYGNSLLKGLPFVTSVLMKIYQSIGQNFERAGNIRYAVTYKPQNDAIDRAYAKDRAEQIASEWSSAMQKGSVKDFVAVGDVDIKVIGADNQVLSSEIPVREMLEQIIAKTGLPPFMLGLSWSSTERMSTQQSDVLTSELWAYRRLLSPVIEKICNTFLALGGMPATAKTQWDEITLQDETELSKARLYNAQAQKIEIENGGGKN